MRIALGLPLGLAVWLVLSATAHAQALDLAASVGWSTTEGDNDPIVTYQGNVPPTTTSGVLNFGFASPGAPQTSTPLLLNIGPSGSYGYASVRGRYGVVSRARVTVQTPAGPIVSPEIRTKPEPRIMRSMPYLKYRNVRPKGAARVTTLRDVRVAGARGWRAYNCRTTPRLSIRSCRRLRGRITTNRPVRLLKRHDSRKRQLKIVLAKVDDKSARRVLLTVSRSGRGTTPGCVLRTQDYRNNCPSISFINTRDRRLNAILVDPGAGFAGMRVGLTCNGPGCPRRYKERRRSPDGKVIRFTGYRGLRAGATLRVSIRARGHDGTSRVLTRTRTGQRISGYQCLRIGSMSAVISCR